MRPYTVSGASLDYPSSNLQVIWYLASFWICLWERGKGKHLSYPATSLVVLQVHQHASLLLRTSHVVLLPLLGIHELLGKTISVLHIVPAATPQPVSGQVLGPGGPAAATAGELSFTASPADGVHHPGSADGVGESGLSATCERDVRSTINERQISFNKRNTQQGARSKQRGSGQQDMACPEKAHRINWNKGMGWSSTRAPSCSGRGGTVLTHPGIPFLFSFHNNSSIQLAVQSWQFLCNQDQTQIWFSDIH